MRRNTIDAQLFRDMVSTAAALLEMNKTVLNDLNVFPVPDGDTGTNMSLTMTSAVREVMSYKGAESVPKLAAELSMGALRGARGNSGVILSQIFRGFSKGIANCDAEIGADDFAKGLASGVEAAYKAVMKPKEGTILTVAKAMGKKGLEEVKNEADIFELFDSVLDEGERVLDITPEMLPVLKEAGVVDAGGKGLIFIISGFRMALNGMEITDFDIEQPSAGTGAVKAGIEVDIEFGYCTEFFVKNLKKNLPECEDRLKKKLESIGDSLVVIGDEGLIKVHVHTNSPGLALQYALALGELSDIKIDNMREQHNEHVGGLQEDVGKEKSKEDKDKPKRPYAIVAVADGEGLKNVFKDLMVDAIIEGGQTMNPSTEDIAKAIKEAHADNVFVLPNNKNIILTAELAAETAECKVFVIPTKSIPQGIASILALKTDADAEANSKAMTDAIHNVKTGQVTLAVRDSKLNGLKIKKDDYLAMLDGDIIYAAKKIDDVCKNLMHKMVDEDSDVLTIFYGKDIQTAEAEFLMKYAEDQFPMCDVTLFNGGQAVYEYIFSVE